MKYITYLDYKKILQIAEKEYTGKVLSQTRRNTA